MTIHRVTAGLADVSWDCASANLKSSPCTLRSPPLPCSARCWLWLARLISRCALSRPNASSANAPTPSETRFTPPVSILRSLKGLDPHMYAAFRSHCLLDYPEYEVLFGVSDPDDPALALVEKLREEFPQAKLRVVHCPQCARPQWQSQQSCPDAAAGQLRAHHHQRQRHPGPA